MTYSPQKASIDLFKTLAELRQTEAKRRKAHAKHKARIAKS